MISKLIVEPLAVAFSDLYEAFEQATNLDEDSIIALQARLFGIPIEEQIAEPGLIEIDATGTTPILIPAGTPVSELETGMTGVIQEEINYSVEEILSLKARGVKIKVPFVGNLPLGSSVSFGKDIGEYKSAVIVKEYKSEIYEPAQEALREILENRPLLYGDSTRAAIEKKLAAFNAEVLDPMNPKNPIFIFDKKRTITNFVFVTYDPETNELEPSRYEITIDSPQIIFGAKIEP